MRSAMMAILCSEAEVLSAPVRHDEPRFVRRDDGLGAVTQPELAQHATDVGLHGLFRDHEALRNEPEHLGLAGCQKAECRRAPVSRGSLLGELTDQATGDCGI